ncbi:SLAP domain-containing protein [Companilactobacillus hulinensis]|uniref:SLAP domain-containing protein n=1 Tax=Companilactobacillus hulinensis TaxID=2486007 RepID=UPI000F7A4B73|nr:SLAP domain-containing protein [Companilactobacillus hulinensis]
MRFQQLKRDPNAIMRKKLYKSGKNWVVKSTLAFVGGAMLLGASTINTVKADVTESASDAATTQNVTPTAEPSNDQTASNVASTDNDKAVQPNSNVADTFNYAINYVAVGGSQGGQILKTVTGTNGTDGESVTVQSLKDLGLTPDGYDSTEVYSDNSLNTVSTNITLKSGQDSYDVYVKSSDVSQHNEVSADNLSVEPQKNINTSDPESSVDNIKTINDSNNAVKDVETPSSDFSDADYESSDFKLQIPVEGGSKWYVDDIGTLHIGPGIVVDPYSVGDVNDDAKFRRFCDYPNSNKIKKVIFSERTVAGDDLDSLFSGLSDINEINISNLDVSQTKIFRSMFMNTSSLREIDLSGWKNQIKDESDFTHFFYRSGIESADLSGLNFSNSMMTRAFAENHNLKNINFSDITAENVLGAYMFSNDDNLESLDISGFHFSISATNGMGNNGILGDISSLNSITISSDIDLTNSELDKESAIYSKGWYDTNNINKRFNTADLINSYSVGGEYYAPSLRTVTTWKAIYGRVPYEIHYLNEDMSPIDVPGKDNVVANNWGVPNSEIKVNPDFPGYSKTAVKVSGPSTKLPLLGLDVVPDVKDYTYEFTVAKVQPWNFDVTENEILPTKETICTNTITKKVEYNAPDENNVTFEALQPQLEKNRTVDLDNTGIKIHIVDDDLTVKLSDLIGVNDLTYGQVLEFYRNHEIDDPLTPEDPLPPNTKAADLLTMLNKFFMSSMDSLMSQGKSTSSATFSLNLVYNPVKVTNTTKYVDEDSNKEIFTAQPIDGQLNIPMTIQTLGQLKQIVSGHAANKISDEEPQVTYDGESNCTYTIKVPKINDYYQLSITNSKDDAESTINVPAYGPATQDDIDKALNALPTDKVDWAKTTLDGKVVEAPTDSSLAAFINELLKTRNEESTKLASEVTETTDSDNLTTIMQSLNVVYKQEVNYTVHYRLEGQKDEFLSVPNNKGYVGDPIQISTLKQLGKITPSYAANTVNIDPGSSNILNETQDYYVTVPKTASENYYEIHIIQNGIDGEELNSIDVNIPMYGTADTLSSDILDNDKVKNLEIDYYKSLFTSGDIVDGNLGKSLDDAEVYKTPSNVIDLINEGVIVPSNDASIGASMIIANDSNTDRFPFVDTYVLQYKTKQATYKVRYVHKNADGTIEMLFEDPADHTSDVGQPVETKTLGEFGPDAVSPGYAAGSVDITQVVSDSGDITYDINVPTVDYYYTLNIKGKDSNNAATSATINVPRYGSASDGDIQTAVDKFSTDHIDWKGMGIDGQTSLLDYVSGLIAKENAASTELAKNAGATTDTIPSTTNQTLDLAYKEQVTYNVNYVAEDDNTKVLYSEPGTHTGDVGDPVEVAPLGTNAQPGYAAGSVDTTQKVVSGQKTYNISVSKINGYYKLTINGNGKSEEISIPKYGNTADKDVQDAISTLSDQDVDWSNVKVGNTTIKSVDDLIKYVADKGSESKNLTPDSDSDNLVTTDETLKLSYLTPKVNYTVNYVTSDGTTIYSDKSQTGRVGDKVTLPTITQLVKEGTLSGKLAGHKADSPATITLTDNDTYTVSIPTISDYLTLNINQTDSNKKPLTTVSTNVPMYGQAPTDVKGLSDKKVDWNNSTVDGKKLSDLANAYGLSTDTAKMSDLVKAILTDANGKSSAFATDTNEDDSKAGNVMNLNVQYKADENNNSGNNTGSNTDNSGNSDNNGESDTGTIVKKSQNVATTGQIVTLYNDKGEIVRNRALAVNSGWYSDEEYTLNGVKYYRVATGEFAKASDVYVYEPMKKSYIKVYDDQIGDLINYLGNPVKNRSLAPSSEWVTDRYALINGNKYYRVATGEFAKLDQVYLYQYTDKVVRTNSNIVPVYDERGNKMDETLPANTSYRADRIVTISGVSYYRIADDAFVKMSDVLPN